MPRIFDNIDEHLLPALAQTLTVSKRADFSVGYFNLRGWKELDQYVEEWSGGEGHCCRLMVGMQRTPQDELREVFRLGDTEDGMDNAQAIRLKRKLAEEFRRQLMLGTPTNEDEAGLRQLAQQLRDKKLVVKLFLRHPLHAKLYLLFRDDFNNPITGYLGSSNLTFAGLSHQGELNIDVLEHDASQKLAHWFDELWKDKFCLDISAELVQVIEESWAGEPGYTPYEIYLKMAYHLAQEARAGVSEFVLPPEFDRKLFSFQKEAVKIAARYLNRRGGVLIGDVVGLGKTFMATALAHVFEEDTGVSTLIICPKNLVKMWQSYVDEYGLRGKVMSSSMVVQQLPEVPARFRQVIIDESHNFRNREGKRYRAIQEYIRQSDSRCILVTATPYNKSYLDLSAQLRLFIPDDHKLSIRPEHFLRQISEAEFSKYQVLPNTLAAFEKSEYADDWRELMRLYLVRRTRSFIKTYYAEKDAEGRYFLRNADGSPNYFPERKPLTLTFHIRKHHQYAKLYSERVVEIINNLGLPRYGLANYLKSNAETLADASERPLLANLSRAGKRLIAYCRTNLYKRLESSGEAFVQSLDRHVLRNHVYLYALEKGLPLPIGTQDAELLDPGNNDEDDDTPESLFDPEAEEETPDVLETSDVYTEANYRARAKQAYEMFRGPYKSRFKWLRPKLFNSNLARRLREDAQNLMTVLTESGPWRANEDRKLERLCKLLTEDHPNDKVLIFTQFADTVSYVTTELVRRGLTATEGVTGASADPTALAWRFSPVSNGKTISPEEHLRVLIATDVLSEGQNLQDAHVVVNYDLPWAIIRLIQRAGRVDRLGQNAKVIQCYSFLPAEGVEEIIKLRARVRRRLAENGEVIGADEQFFENERANQDLRDLYTEKSGVLDDESMWDDTDPASQAFAVWQEAASAHPALARKVEAMPDVVLSTRAHAASASSPEGVLVYMRTTDDLDLLGRVDKDGQIISESPLAVLRAAECEPDTPAIPRHPNHHDLVRAAMTQMAREAKSGAGQLGKSSGVRYRTYIRLKAYYDDLKVSAPLLATDELEKTIDVIYRYPLREAAKDILNRQLKAGVSDANLARLVTNLRHEDRLSLVPEDSEEGISEPRIICSLGLFTP